MIRRLMVCAWLAVALLAGAAAAQCEGVEARQEEQWVVVTHETDYNCAVFEMFHEACLEGAVLHVTELANADGWADCYCPYESKVTVLGLAPGDYTVRFEYAETVLLEEPAGWQVCELPLTVTAVDVDAGDLVIESEAAGCGIAVTGVGEEWPVPAVSWSALKDRFR